MPRPADGHRDHRLGEQDERHGDRHRQRALTLPVDPPVPVGRVAVQPDPDRGQPTDDGGHLVGCALVEDGEMGDGHRGPGDQDRTSPRRTESLRGA